MTDYPHYELDAVAQDVFDLMRRQPGDTFAPGDLAGQVGDQLPRVAAALEQLLELGFITRVSEAPETYILSPAAPEL